ncbi:hypothetical protein K8O68_12540 [Salipaludibacillus sp. CUR1]|uniref:hypothetical protein n=1 Tax=Salipaludibacillus sp. CUR1 TaxID=2820003 RepID=UPI001E2914F8|nr:hypothetical protein [Salipaludibacillus sp. CUR1]MCE7793247.1 hypothetical protein [Salipaludibacillus sp. CUR1]
MERKLTILINIYAVFLLLFVLAYYGYYLYIGILWGFGERMFTLLVSDSLFLLFIPAAVGILFKKTWSWWLNMIIFFQLFIAKFIALGANVTLLMTDTVAQPLQGSNLLVEILYLVLYLIIITALSLKIVKQRLSVNRRFGEWFWRVFTGAIGLYVFHFIITLLVIAWVSPV